MMKNDRTPIKLDQIRVASPCNVTWESMHGDERVRHCDSCKLNVYNISSMSAETARELIGNREGRLCIRLFRRPDGTVLTRDCPVGLRKYQKRIARYAGAALATILGLFSVSYGQKAKTIDANDLGTAISSIKRDDGRTLLRGTVTDPNGATVPNVRITLLGDNGKKIFSTVGNEDGGFSIDLPTGSYTLQAELDGFLKTKIENITLLPGNETTIELMLFIEDVEVTVGIYLEPDRITSAAGTTILSGKSID